MSNDQDYPHGLKIGMRVKYKDGHFLLGVITSVSEKEIWYLPTGNQYSQANAGVSGYAEYTDEDARLEPFNRLKNDLEYDQKELAKAKKQVRKAQKALDEFKGERE